MLVLSRKPDERVYLDFTHPVTKDRIRIVVTVIRKVGGGLALGVTAPPSVTVMREELVDTSDREPQEKKS